MNQRLEETLKKNDLRLTSARQVIFQVLNTSEKALSAQDVCRKIDSKSKLKTDHASVYRNLNTFVQVGLVHRFQDGRYSVCTQDEGHRHDHVHVVANCTECGLTYEIEEHSKDLCNITKRMTSYAKSFGRFSGLILEGLCKECI